VSLIARHVSARGMLEEGRPHRIASSLTVAAEWRFRQRTNHESKSCLREKVQLIMFTTGTYEHWGVGLRYRHRQKILIIFLRDGNRGLW